MKITLSQFIFEIIMNILLVFPQYPDTYWSFKHALKFISKKASNIPLGLITVASLLPDNWNKKLIDLNVSGLRDKDIRWAEYVFISAMSVQTASVKQIIERCMKLRVKMVAGGPLFTEEYEQFPEIDHLVLNEAEITLPLFIEDIKNGCPKKIYHSDEFADITKSPLPDYSLLKTGKYATAGIQYSRGCPYDCEFCDITALFGHKVRTKSPAQIIAELDQLIQIGWRGSVFFVDDNFIGHKKRLKNELLSGYQKIIKNIYSCKAYYARVLLFLKKYNPPSVSPMSLNKFMVLTKSILYIGVLKKESIYFWKILFWSVFNKPKSFPLAVTYSIYGYHFRRIFREVI